MSTFDRSLTTAIEFSMAVSAGGSTSGIASMGSQAFLPTFVAGQK